MVESIYKPRPDDEDIDEVYSRLFMSNYAAARNITMINKFGITHILTVTPYTKP